MTSREVFLETCLFRNPTRAYRWECIGIWEETYEKWKKQGYSAGPKFADFLNYFGMDWHVGFMNFQEETGLYTGFANTPFFPGFRRRVLRKEGKTRIVRTSTGVVQRELVNLTESSMPQFLSFPVETRKDWESIKPRLDPFSKGRYPSDWSALLRRYERRDFVLGMPMIGAFGLLRNLMGPENALISFYDDPGLVAAIMAHWEWMNKGFISAVSEHLTLDYILLWEDMCFRSGPLISPDLFRRFMLPHYQEVIAHAKGRGIPVAAVDTDGRCSALIPLFLEGGVNLLFPLEVQSGMDVREVRKAHGSRLALLGGLDKRALAVGKEAIADEVNSKLPPLLEEGGYIPALDHSAPPDISLDNFGYFLDTVRAISDRILGNV